MFIQPIFSLDRFLNAQEQDYAIALAEVSAGRKRSHWMWYIFPQLAGLGHSEISKHYAIKGLTEAEAYLKHPILGFRLIEICEELIKLKTNDATTIFGTPDDLKLKSCATLFSSLKNCNPVFAKILEKFFRGEKDQNTLDLFINNTF